MSTPTPTELDDWSNAGIARQPADSGIPDTGPAPGPVGPAPEDPVTDDGSTPQLP